MKWYELEARNCREHRQRRLAHALRVQQMTGGVVGDFDRQRSTFAWAGSGEKLADIAHSRAQVHGSLVPVGIILQ